MPAGPLVAVGPANGTKPLAVNGAERLHGCFESELGDDYLRGVELRAFEEVDFHLLGLELMVPVFHGAAHEEIIEVYVKRILELLQAPAALKLYPGVYLARNGNIGPDLDKVEMRLDRPYKIKIEAACVLPLDFIAFYGKIERKSALRYIINDYLHT